MSVIISTKNFIVSNGSFFVTAVCSIDDEPVGLLLFSLSLYFFWMTKQKTLAQNIATAIRFLLTSKWMICKVKLYFFQTQKHKKNLKPTLLLWLCVYKQQKREVQLMVRTNHRHNTNKKTTKQNKRIGKTITRTKGIGRITNSKKKGDNRNKPIQCIGLHKTKKKKEKIFTHECNEGFPFSESFHATC
ncbi:hypothetical protein RFI_32288 [Reticulomyxa filosa]|uniref:Uncharacterized protein n=1 Tax=Reticulomyxa filosa TaxID=46433 RepID=X6LT47_RETFI|nr:hypothetical protein RFI_32288 [Reticulomyxa filosa]|eukprot:ETO05108.1 hypothetical protein RFI_32288 [Reticulomyxa filosa]